MVRFIIIEMMALEIAIKIFTFQYGQIYYNNEEKGENTQEIDLHSNMVRFIMKKNKRKISTATRIYIPIWLDLL